LEIDEIFLKDMVDATHLYLGISPMLLISGAVSGKAHMAKDELLRVTKNHCFCPSFF
jgi:hypothetical protein